MRIQLNLPLTVREVATAIGAPLHYPPDSTINAITTNSSEVQSGDLFVALRGENFDGNDFVSEALLRGGFVISEIYDGYNLTVRDTKSALLKLAKYYKSKLPRLQKTIAITGSVGKTTTKNILADMLSREFKVHATNENFNNSLGVCLTLLSAPEATEILVVEMGMNHIGEIAELSRAITPNISIITNVGTAHVGNLGSREMIAKAKLEIKDGMSKDGILILPHAEPLFVDENTPYTASVRDSRAFCYCEIAYESHLYTKIRAFIEGENILDATLKLPGEHVAIAVSLSIAVAKILGISNDLIKHAVENINPLCARGRLIELNGYKIYDDTYSSSPEAVISDFKLLSLHPQKRSCVIGDMLELGSRTEELHRKIGAAVYEYGFCRLFAFGVYAPFVAAGAFEAGMSAENIHVNTDITAPNITADQIRDHVRVDEIILVKASHALHAERIYDFLK